MRINHQVVVFDAADIEAESRFWAGVLGGTVDLEDHWHMVMGEGPANPGFPGPLEGPASPQIGGSRRDDYSRGTGLSSASARR